MMGLLKRSRAPELFCPREKLKVHPHTLFSTLSTS
jgi:hypothetical protein